MEFPNGITQLQLADIPHSTFRPLVFHMSSITVFIYSPKSVVNGKETQFPTLAIYATVAYLYCAPTAIQRKTAFLDLCQTVELVNKKCLYSAHMSPFLVNSNTDTILSAFVNGHAVTNKH